MPHAGRVAGGIILAAACAPIVVGVALAVLQEPPMDMQMATGWVLTALTFGFPLALFPALLVALPAYLLLRRRWPMRWWHAALAGALIGAIIWPLGSMDMDLATLAVTTTAGVISGLAFRLAVGRDRREAGAAA